MLNQRQELFCQNILNGKSATKAARDAGYSEKTAYSIGARLLKHVEITKRLAALQLAVSSGNIATKQQREEILTKIATEGHKEPITAQDKVRAIAELNKMGGDYAPEKHAVLGDIVIEIVHRDKEG